MEDRVNSKFEEEKKSIKELIEDSSKNNDTVDQIIKEKEVKSEKQIRELKSQISELKL